MNVIEIYNWVVNNWDVILQIITGAVTLASIIVKLTPTLKDDAFMKKVIKFLGKYVALEKYSPVVKKGKVINE